MKYRKKPVVIEAIQLTDSTLTTVREVLEFMGQSVNTSTTYACDKFYDYCGIVEKQGIKIPTLEGEMNASIGDYIIRGVQGELYPCKPDIFEQTYEEVISTKM